MSCSLFEGFLWMCLLIALYVVISKLLRAVKVDSIGSRSIFITGCDTGFGRAAAIRLDKRGCSVFAACLTEKGATELRKHCSSRLKTVSLDVTNHESVTQAYEAVEALLPPGKGLWGLVNNAGILGKIGAADWFNSKDFLEVLSINVLGMADVTSTFLPLLKMAKGRVVNVSSPAGRGAAMGILPYSVSKYGVESYSDGLRRQLRDVDVSVHIIEPKGAPTSILSEENLTTSARRAWVDVTPAEVVAKNEHVFKDHIDKMNENIDKFIIRYSTSVDHVASAYEDALLSRFPKCRYVVGWDSWLVIVISKLPEWLSDFMMVKIFKSPFTVFANK